MLSSRLLLLVAAAAVATDGPPPLRVLRATPARSAPPPPPPPHPRRPRRSRLGGDRHLRSTGRRVARPHRGPENGARAGARGRGGLGLARPGHCPVPSGRAAPPRAHDHGDGAVRGHGEGWECARRAVPVLLPGERAAGAGDRKSTRLNSSHVSESL